MSSVSYQGTELIFFLTDFLIKAPTRLMGRLHFLVREIMKAGQWCLEVITAAKIKVCG